MRVLTAEVKKDTLTPSYKNNTVKKVYIYLNIVKLIVQYY